MKISRIFLSVLMLFFAVSVYAASVKIASEDDIKLLKKDFLNGNIRINKTRLKKIREAYGDPKEIRDSEKTVRLDYGDIRLDFDKKKYWRDWEYDFSHKPAYSDDIDDLRYDLESGELVGQYVTLDRVINDYVEPTEEFPKFEDGEISVYYWGELRLTFENVYVLKSFRGKNLEAAKSENLVTQK